jgi:hypothetical protein
MTDRDDGVQRSGEDGVLTSGEALVQDLLIEDGLAWRRSVPTNDRLNVTVRALSNEAPALTRICGRRKAEIQVRALMTSAVGEDRTAIVGAMVAASLLVGLFGTILYNRAGHDLSSPTGPATVMTTPTVTPQALPTSIPGRAGRYVQGATTAHAVDSNFVPIDVTSRFHAGDRVYVVLFLRGLPKGQKHTLTVQWYLGNMQLELPGTATTSIVVDGSKNADQNVAFSLNYPTAGRGRATIYWDLPRTAVAQLGPYVAQDITFIVQ